MDWTASAGAPLTVSLVQGAIPQDLKWQADNREQTFKVYTTLNEQAMGSRIVVWPEAALPLLAHEIKDYLDALQERARTQGSEIVMGLLRYDFSTKEYRNALLVLNDKRESYDKRRLVPFGEFFPVPDFVRSWMRLMSLPYVDISKGEAQQPALNVADQKLGATICYEDAYGSEQLAVLRDATLLVNVTNDAWFGDSTAPHQHLEIARMRALEAGRYLLRAANDGITATIGPAGELRRTIPQFKAGILSDIVEPRTGLTPYAKVGNLPVILLSFLLLAAGVYRHHKPASR
jgi:apolipoprotein N-acyltransferase